MLDLHAECAVLYGKLGEHEKALDLLVHRLEDHAAAEQYCYDLTKGKVQCACHSTLHAIYLSKLESEPFGPTEIVFVIIEGVSSS